MLWLVIGSTVLGVVLLGVIGAFAIIKGGEVLNEYFGKGD